MRAIKIYCGGCKGSFTFRHPSVSHPYALSGVTINCRACGVPLVMPSDELHMIPLAEATDRAAGRQHEIPEVEDQGYKPTFNDTDEYPTIGEVIDSTVLEVDFKKRAKVTPKVMPPHPPKPFARTSQERPRRPLFQKPFQGLDRVFDQEKD